MKTHMTWVRSQKRWTKSYKGKSYSVSCQQLNAPATKEESRVAANNWWVARQASLTTGQIMDLSEELNKLGNVISHARRLVDRSERKEEIIAFTELAVRLELIKESIEKKIGLD